MCIITNEPNAMKALIEKAQSINFLSLNHFKVVEILYRKEIALSDESDLTNDNDGFESASNDGRILYKSSYENYFFKIPPLYVIILVF